MSTYSVSQVETLTGIKAHTLRIWERRYNIVNPQRTETNIRYYTDEQLRKLLNVGILLRNGYKVSKIDQMDNSEIHEIVTDISLNSSHEKQDDINALTISMLEMDEIKFNKLYELHVAKSGLLLTVTDLFYPFLNHVGVLWGTNKLLPAQEHFTTNLIRQKLISAIDQLPATPPAAPKIVFFLLEGENHEIALLLAAFIAKNLGWHIYYLGQNVPATDISTIISSILPNIMMTMFIAPRPDEFGHYINSIIKDNDVPLLFSGNPDNLDISIVDNRITFIASPKKFISFLKKI